MPRAIQTCPLWALTVRIKSAPLSTEEKSVLWAVEVVFGPTGRARNPDVRSGELVVYSCYEGVIRHPGSPRPGLWELARGAVIVGSREDKM